MKIGKLSRATAFFLSFVMLLSPVANAAGDNIVLFKDNEANYLKYISGYGDGTIRPDDHLTRAQCAQMLSYIIDTENVGNASFSDVSPSFWGYDAINVLSCENVIGGYPDGTFRPDKSITRGEFATIIARMVETEEGSATFTDIQNHWAKSSISALSKAGYINGYADNTFKPNAPITRAEAVKVINKAVEISVNDKENREVFTDLTTEHWAYYEIMSAVSLSAIKSPIKREKIDFNTIEYIEISVEEIDGELERILNEFVSASVERQAEIFSRVSTIESDVALAIAMSNINAQRDVTSVKDKNNLANSALALNAIKKAKEKRYKFLAVVKSPEEFEKLIGMKIADIPEPDKATADKLVSLYAEEQGYENDFNTFMYSESIVHNGKKYSLAQSEASSDVLLYAKALDYYLDNRIEYGTIFSNLIKVRNKIANFFGYRYYTELGYMRAGKYYYTPEDVAVIREDVKKYIAPLVFNIKKAAQGHDNGYYNLNSRTAYKMSEASMLEQAEEFLNQLSPQTREALKYLKNSNLIDSEPRQNKATTAFTTYINAYEAPYIFINENGSTDDIENMVHEFGHAFHAYRIGVDGVGCPADVAEVASYGMEMLSVHNYETFYGEEAAEKVEFINLYYKLLTMLQATFMDEFQYKVYKDIFLTIDERNSLYASLYKEYYIGTNYSHEAYRKGIVWANPTHLFTEPYYSIDYTLALVVAFQLWEIGENEGLDSEFEAYMGILESEYINTSVHSVALSAGLNSPFAKDVIKSISEKIDLMFKEKYKKEKAS